MNGSIIWRKLRNRLVGLIIPMSVLLAVVSCGTAKQVQESVIVRDTVVITKERRLIDTLILFKDTVIYQDRVKLKIEYRDNFVNVEAECPSDTIRIETIKILNAPKKNQRMDWQGFLGWIIVILCGLIILQTLLKELMRKLF